ncbi:transposase family protein [Streptomyces sp. NRRL S-378]|uniref:transposase family protein n=1 Tax=Streptomyces sp. NRRL S-378 TaxID=1463904 RepID=UPI001F32F54A|nr:transposase family protein [Streptomyces sp. NRRL S-378]
MRLSTLAEVIDHLGASGRTGIIDGTEIRVRRPAVGRKDRDKFISGKNKQNAVTAIVLTDASGRLLFCSPAQPASCADITHARQLGLVNLPTACNCARSTSRCARGRLSTTPAAKRGRRRRRPCEIGPAYASRLRPAPTRAGLTVQ